MKPDERVTGKPSVMGACDKAKDWIHDTCDEHRPLDPEERGGGTPPAQQHVASCGSCLQEVALIRELERLLASEPPVDPPAELVPSVMAAVRADLARARRNARLALAGAIAALVGLAFGVTFFDVVQGALGLANDLLGWAAVARGYAPTAPSVPAFELPAVAPLWVFSGLGLAVAALALEVRVLARRAAA